MGSISDYLYRIQELTRTNLELLTAINNSFLTKKEHLSVLVEGKEYTIPSFIALENKINTLQNDFENLVDVPKTGTAAMTFDGNTQRIQLMGYSNTPNAQHLDSVSSFLVDKNDILKDFMTPTPYIHLNLNNIDNNIKTVCVKKVALKNAELVGAVETAAAGSSVSYGDVFKILDRYEEDRDYVEYDTVKRLPVKTGAPLGRYSVKKIDSHELDDNFEEHYTLTVNEDLTYTVNSEAIEQVVRIGDWLVTDDDTIKLLVEDIHTGSRSVTVKVMYGAYSDIAEGSFLRYYKYSDYTPFKYTDVPLEEDRHICVFVAAVNDDMNIQAPWGDGLYIDTDTLTVVIDSEVYGFREYYDRYVNNVGDTIYGICTMVNNTVNNISKERFEEITRYVPTVPVDHYSVVQINKHLNDSETVADIRRLYDQKSTYKSELSSVQLAIENLTRQLSELAFDDTTNNRQLYSSQLSEQNAKKTELTNAIAAVSQEIAESANNAELPVENAKYHIRGYAESSVEGMPKIIRLDVQYRYKNKNKFNGNAVTINDSFIYSDWNLMQTFTDMRHPSTDGVNYTFEYEQDTSNMNVPSWNQIDIPISQGEVVDFKVRYVFDLGWPFVTVTSQWSDIYTVEFPTEFLANIEILDIIEENNSDVKAYQFDSKLKKEGIYEHVGDSLNDQDMKYFHKAENIASGFFTDERRVIPVKDVLDRFNSDILDLKSEVFGLSSEDLVVSLSDDKQNAVLRPYVDNTFIVQDYVSNATKTKLFASVESNNTAEVAYAQLTLTIYNGSEYNGKLFAMFPGPYKSMLLKNAPSRFDASDFSDVTVTSAGYSKNGVFMKQDRIGETASTCTDPNCTCSCHGEEDAEKTAIPQRYNQFVNFRMKDIYTGAEYYHDYSGQPLTFDQSRLNGPNDSSILSVPDSWSEQSSAPAVGGGKYYCTMYPYIGQLSGVCIDSQDSYRIIAPGETVSIPISFYYWFSPSLANNEPDYMTRTLSFDIRTSLYHDPVTYKITVGAGKTASTDTTVRRDSRFDRVTYSSQVVKSAYSKINDKSLFSVVNTNKPRR